MHIVYARQELPPIGADGLAPNSIFLVGPTPRQPEYVESWRPQALDILKTLGFEGTVLVPEDDEWVYGEQTRWEWRALKIAASIPCWIARDLSLTPKGELRMPAFTSNIEYGFLGVLKPEQLVLGAPPGAKHVGYMKQFAEEFHDVWFGKKLVIPVFDTLEATLAMAVEIATAKNR